MSRPVEAVLLGAGSRGTFTFGQAALSSGDTLRFVGVAEPNPERRHRFAAQHGVEPNRCFESWQDLLAADQLAPALVCCTGDRLHVEPAVSALDRGYHVLLEKPMAVTAVDCVRIVAAAERAQRELMICHVLRYAPFFSALHEVVASGVLGEIVSVEHRENVAYWHMAHSYVRGNWSRMHDSSPTILAKCCHDLDLLVWNRPDDPVTRIHSFGSLHHFRPERAPEGAPHRCTDGCPASETCPFFAPRLYLTENLGWPTEAISVDLSLAARLNALETGPYGRCVYQTGSDALDHQVVSMEHASGATSTVTMQGHSHREERTLRWDGTRATLRGAFRYGDTSELTVHDHRDGRVEQVPIGFTGESGHGGGDERLLRDFARIVQQHSVGPRTSARSALESHLLAFAAEESRLAGTVVDMSLFRREVEHEAHIS